MILNCLKFVDNVHPSMSVYLKFPNISKNIILYILYIIILLLFTISKNKMMFLENLCFKNFNSKNLSLSDGLPLKQFLIYNCDHRCDKMDIHTYSTLI